MLRRVLASVSLVAILALLVATGVHAATTKYTFNDVEIDGQIVEIEASVKDNKKNDFSSCSYYTDDYVEFLGTYQEDVVAGDTAEEVLEFCVEHFAERTQ